jgi:hypothetical protein
LSKNKICSLDLRQLAHRSLSLRECLRANLVGCSNWQFDDLEVPGSHAIYVSNPNAVAALIEQAASGVK